MKPFKKAFYEAYTNDGTTWYVRYRKNGGFIWWHLKDWIDSGYEEVRWAKAPFESAQDAQTAAYKHAHERLEHFNTWKAKKYSKIHTIGWLP